jgi:hypothetical protein
MEAPAAAEALAAAPAPADTPAPADARVEAEVLRSMPFADGIDARLLAATACPSWLANAAVTGLAWGKLRGTPGFSGDDGVSWPLAFAPLWAAHAVQLLLHAHALTQAVRTRAPRPPRPETRPAGAGAALCSTVWGVACAAAAARRYACLRLR